MLTNKFIKNKNLIRLYLIKKYRTQTKQMLHLKFVEQQKKIKQGLIEDSKNSLNKTKYNLFLTNYYFLMQCLIKKGQKETIEKIFKNSLIF
jgi:hypothetical protein